MFEGNILLIMIRSHTIPNLCLVNVIGIPFHSYDTRRLSRRIRHQLERRFYNS